MAAIQLSNWGDLGWAKLGDSGERTDIFVNRLRMTGEYEIKRDSDFTWCKLRREHISFFRFLTSISQDNYRDDKIYQFISDNKPQAEFHHGVDISQRKIGELAEEIQKASEPLDRLYKIKDLLLYESYDGLTDLIRDIVSPLFFRDYPDGRIYFIAIHDSLRVFLALVRVLYLISIYGYATTKTMMPSQPTGGADALKKLTGYIEHPYALISILSSLFFPKFHFFGSVRLGSFILFQLGQPFEFHPKYPYDFFDFVRSREIFDETVDIDLGNIQKGSDEKERLAYRRFVHKRDWTSDELERFAKWYIQKISGMFYEFLDATNFVDDKTGCISFIKQFNFLHTIQRVLAETSVIMTERDPQVRKPLFFELLDKYGAILEGNDAENFKSLLKVTNYESNIKHIIKDIPEPFGSYFAEDFGQTIFEEIHRVVIEDKYLASRISGDNVSLISWDKNSGTFIDRGKTQTKEDYVVNMLRTVRNTHHGYLDDPRNRFEKFLSIHSGSTPHYIADLSQLFVLSMISDPDKLLDSQWI